MAFTLGNKCTAGVDLFKIIGCHTDSPVLKLAPFNKVEKLGYQQMNIQTYGGGIWRTWFDRDLGLAGRVVVKEKDSSKLSSKLWDSKQGVVYVPSLCIHLDREQNFQPNKETHIKPILATSVIDQLMGEGIKPFEDKPDVFNVGQKNYTTFLDRIARDLEVNIDQIVDFELSLYDSYPAQITGIHSEFISSPRLDNLASSLCSLDAIIDFSKNGNKDNAEASVIMLFDHEEIGSTSGQGADSNMVVETTERIGAACNKEMTREDYYRSIKRSFLISADMAHAIHPNYAEKHQPQHHPKMHEGIVIKINANQRYMTDSVSASVLRTLAANAEEPVPIQDFMIKQDGLCGSTIGPAMAAKCGMKTIDIGAPQLSMHSIRETCGVIDMVYYQRLFNVFLNNYSKYMTDPLNL